jgi:imidazolonepropionase-like amidohydrolase
MRYTAEEFPERLDDPAWQEGMPAELAAEIRESLRSIPHLPYYALFPARIPHLPTKFQQLRESGVQLMIGTDAGIPSIFHNDATWREMALWVKLGVPPMQVIQAATLWPARFLGVQQELGTLAPGRLADMIAVRGDPLTNMEVLRDVQVVVKGGHQVR